MIHGRNVIAVLAVLLLPVAAAAASAGKVVIAQGVDPTTLDIMNQQESPASIIAAHIFETLWERDPNLKIIPALATEMPNWGRPPRWEANPAKGASSPTAKTSTPKPRSSATSGARVPKPARPRTSRPTIPAQSGG